MIDYSIFKCYITSNDSDTSHKKHVFFRVLNKDILETEELLETRLPEELRSFYLEVGYGFICYGQGRNTNRIIAPIEISDFYEGINTYENDDRRNYYSQKERLVFLEVHAQAFLTIDTKHPNSVGQFPIYFDDRKIADSLIEFLKKMDDKVDYYMM